MKKYVGELMMGTAVLHTAVGVIFGNSQLGDIVTYDLNESHKLGWHASIEVK